ncbi:hypothetical protein ACFSE1_06050 [Rhizobium helianthi]|uniref:Uncharacterized protein n=1 Tax=Rhizobium helianthi TaxID=1132695 RepID=A0ABW4M0R0_9HYPH
MSQFTFSNCAPTPFEMLVNFRESGNATFISYLFREKAEWLSRNLSPEQEKVCDGIRAQLATWVEMEKIHGPGAALNLGHQEMMELFRALPWVRKKFASQIANAKRLAAM